METDAKQKSEVIRLEKLGGSIRGRLIIGDILEGLAKLPDACIAAVVTDPPYELGLMGKTWDKTGVSFRPETWQAILRVLKPGGHLLSFGGTRTEHRITCAIEDAGFEVRDKLMWLYGQGFRKSLNLKDGWEGWGTGLKPAWEPIILARKPLSESTVAANVLKWGIGGLNVDGTRIATKEHLGRSLVTKEGAKGSGGWQQTSPAGSGSITDNWKKGRWPPNLILDEEAAKILNEQAGARRGSETQRHLTDSRHKSIFGVSASPDRPSQAYDDAGGASRFFYCPKATSKERGEGNSHPTVKPLALMQWLVRLVTPPNGVVLDPFCGSGSTLVAAVREDHSFVGIDVDRKYCAVAEQRIVAEGQRPRLIL